MNQSNDDTFLSRVFGLHSVYNQLNDNYQYYDDTNDLENNFNSVEPINLSNLKRRDRDILNSDSDSDSDESVQQSNINWNLPKHDIDNKGKAIKFNIPQEGNSNVQETRNEVSNDSVFVNRPKKPATETNKKFRSRFQIPPKERALYLWANIVNMDEFLNDMYYYYRNRGVNNIVLSKVIDLFIIAFILWFSVFLKWGVNYEAFQNWDINYDEKITLNDLVKPHYIWNLPIFIKFLLFGFVSYIILRSVQLYFDYKYKLKEIQNFYHQLIDIKNDDELMTISWIKVVEKILQLKSFNSLTSEDNDKILNDLSSKIRLNPQDIANRIMRKENYFIALINKDIIDLSVNFGPIKLTNSNVLTKTLEWNLKLCIFNFVFNTNGQINNNILKDFNRNQLSADLNKRFKMAAIINLILSPFLVIYFILLYFFSNFNDYRLNPSYLINLRQFTPFAEWKLREFNELPHFFNKRIKLSIGPSNNYINQFPSNFLVINITYLVNFISGAILTILVIFGLLLEDEDHSFWSFELTENRSTLFYISIFGTIFAITSSGSPSSSTGSNDNDNKNYYYDPEASIKYVSQFTHYLPSHWQGKLHTQQVKNEYCQLFNLKILIIFNEILSIILTPFLLWFKISNLSSSIIDFFRDYSIHIDGLGYICYFSMFNFEQKDKNMMANKKHKRKKSDDSDLYQDDKMIKSYMYFLESYQPDNVTTRVTKPVTKKDSPDNSNFINSYEFNASDDEEEIKLGKSGVLGMLNQFYKQDLNKN